MTRNVQERMAKKKSISGPPSLEAQNAAFLALRQTALPVTAKQLAGLLVAPFKISEALLIPILEESAAKAECHIFSPSTAKGKLRYWDRDLIEFGRITILQLVQKKGPQTKAKLKTAAKSLSDSQFHTSFQKLIEAGLLREHPPLGKSKTLKYGTEPPASEPYLKDIEKQLKKIVEQLLSAGVERQTLIDAVLDCVAQAGLPQNKDTALPEQPALNDLSGVNLLVLMRQIEPGADRGALVTSRELRLATNLDKPEFDHTVLSLARQGRLMLHRHDHASGLSPSERDELVTDGSGTYYVGMALRRTDD